MESAVKARDVFNDDRNLMRTSNILDAIKDTYANLNISPILNNKTQNNYPRIYREQHNPTSKLNTH